MKYGQIGGRLIMLVILCKFVLLLSLLEKKLLFELSRFLKIFCGLVSIKDITVTLKSLL